MKVMSLEKPVFRLKVPFPVDESNLHYEFVEGSLGSWWMMIDVASVGKLKRKRGAKAGNYESFKKQNTPSVSHKHATKHSLEGF